jgi:choline dehydrogenase/4-pyridoxate dehydrogenase
MRNTGGYEYIIVGAGSAGCTLANRLTEDAGTRVLLLEAGGWDRNPLIHIPLGWGKIFQDRLYDWGYFAEPEPALNGRGVECARGKVIGGSSSVNALFYVRGHRGDYERWAASGLPSWSFAHVLPYFKRQETWEGGANAYRGGSGPLSTQYSRYADPLVEAYLEAGKQAGHPATGDYNGAQQEGFCLGQITIRKGRRCSAAVAYLRPALEREGLRVETRALVSHLLIDRTRVTGLVYEKGGETHTVHADREVLLCAGAINSPQVLMLSGVGDPQELTRHDIRTQVSSPGVGRNLRDHFTTAVEYRRREPGPFRRHMRLDRAALCMAQAYFFGTGYATDLPSGWTAFLKSGPEQKLPDLQLIIRAGPPGADVYLAPFKPAFADGFLTRAALLRPESTGRVRLASANPRDKIRIHFNPLAAEADWRALRAGLRLIRELGRHRALSPFVEKELAPRPDEISDDALNVHIRSSLVTAHHPCGTCRMGRPDDDFTVVDERLRVRGLEGLRVIDASVFPDLIGGNINAVVIMIAEKAADLIRGRELPAEEAPADEPRAPATVP